MNDADRNVPPRLARRYALRSVRNGGAHRVERRTRTRRWRAFPLAPSWEARR
jgi:hypothetical protein